MEMKNRIEKNKLGVIILVALCLPVVSSLAATSQLTSMPNVIPEPASIMMIGLGGALIAGYRRFFGRI